MRKMITSAVVFLLVPSLVIGASGGEAIEAVCPDIFRTNVNYSVEFTPLTVPTGAVIVGLVPKYNFNSGNTSGLSAFIGSPSEEAFISLNGAMITEPFAGDPAKVKFYMRFRVGATSQETIIPTIRGGKCSLIVNWKTPIVLKNTPITGPKEIIVGQTAEYNVYIPEAVDYWTAVSTASICEVVGAQDKNTVVIRGLSPGQCTLKRAAGIANDPKVNIVSDTLTVDVVLSPEAKKAAAIQPAINMLLLDK